MIVLGLQYDVAWVDRAANAATIRRLIKQAAPPPRSLVVVPEMALTGYSMQVDRVADTAALESETALAAIARESGCWLVGGVVSRRPDGIGRNEALVVDPTGSVTCRYAKMHPFSFAGEQHHYAPGGNPTVVDCDEFRLAPFVCYDLRFPEIFRTAARRGANLIVVIACWLEHRHAHWRALLQARAVENQSWVVGVNRIGRDPKHAYLGGSCIIDPTGKIAAEAVDQEAVVSAVAAVEVASRVRREFPVLTDMRADWTHP